MSDRPPRPPSDSPRPRPTPAQRQAARLAAPREPTGPSRVGSGPQRPRPRRRRDPATYVGPKTNPNLDAARAIGEWLILAAGMTLFALILKIFVLQAYLIPSGSMEDTLQINDRIVVNKLAIRFGEAKRGDIVVFNSPPAELATNPDIKVLVKRVVAVPGDTIYSTRGLLYVNNQAVDEPYLKPGVTTEDVEPQILQPGQYFMMGDNREDSQDSRFFGPVTEDLFIGKAALRLWPLNSLRTF